MLVHHSAREREKERERERCGVVWVALYIRYTALIMSCDVMSRVMDVTSSIIHVMSGISQICREERQVLSCDGEEAERSSHFLVPLEAFFAVGDEGDAFDAVFGGVAFGALFVGFGGGALGVTFGFGLGVTLGVTFGVGFGDGLGFFGATVSVFFFTLTGATAVFDLGTAFLVTTGLFFVLGLFELLKIARRRALGPPLLMRFTVGAADLPKGRARFAAGRFGRLGATRLGGGGGGRFEDGTGALFICDVAAIR